MADLQAPGPDLQQLLSVLILQNQRIYDVLLILLGHFDEEKARQVVDVHEQLDNIGPIPFQVDDD